MGRRKKKGYLHIVTRGMAVLCLFLVAACAACIGKDVRKGIEKGLKQNGSIPYQEVGISDDELSQKYYYQQLEDGEKQAYKEIVQGVKENVEEIYVHASDADRTNMLFQYVLKDFPEIFWCDGMTTSTSYEGSEDYTVLKPVYLYDAGQKEAMKEKIEASVNECLAAMPAKDTDYQKILYVYEYIVNTVDYDLEAADNQNIYSVFVNRHSVCAGYSKATQYLLERLGVFCTYVTGTTLDGQSHAWNLVRCSGNYYYVDTTWGDPVFQATEGEEVNQKQMISYDYMCCNDGELFKTHTPDQDVALPACQSMAENYYVVNGMYYESYDIKGALQKMNEVISSKSNPVVFKFADNGLYGQAHDSILQDVVRRAAQNLADWYGLQEVKYQYMDEPELNKITIFWQYE